MVLIEIHFLFYESALRFTNRVRSKNRKGNKMSKSVRYFREYETLR